MRLHRPLPLLLLVVATAVAVAAPTVGAQGATGTIQGTITDSIHARPAGAMVLLTRLSPEPSEFRSTLADEKGRFHFDSLVAGRYSVAFATPYLDSLALTLPSREVTVANGQTVRADFATPSGATLRAAACPGLNLPKGQGAVIGQVSDADTDRPLTSAHVAVSWTDLSLDKTTFKAVTTQRGGEVAVDSLGRYRLCGVPTDIYLLVQVQDSGRAGSVLSMIVGDEGGVLVRDLSLSKQSARSLAALDSAATAPASNDTVGPPPLTGTATITGIIQGAQGNPLSGAQVRVRDAVGVANTDSSGRFTLTGLPAGSQLLETRRVGYLLSQIPVELRSGRTVDATVTLTRIANLDSIRIVAQRSRYSEFEQRRKSSGSGRFLEAADIEKRHPFETSDLFRMMPGFRVSGYGLDARLVSTRGRVSFNGGCSPNVVINGMQHQEINLLNPVDIGAMEIYAGPAGAPMQYDSACGVVVIWMKR